MVLVKTWLKHELWCGNSLFYYKAILEQGNLKNNPEEFILSDYFQELLDDLKSFNGTHNVIITHNEKNSKVYLDKKLLKICLTNLIVNAFKYTPKGGKIEMLTEFVNTETVRIMVADDGIGIPDEDQSRIFDTFFRAHNAGNFEGTGLGLNITKRFITLMGGTIDFSSKENQGTMFNIYLPFKKKDD